MWLVGAGYWGSKLLASLEKFDVEARVIDIRNGQTIDDINDTAPVMLATPLWQHHEQACRLLERGHDVYVEKPMAETYEQVLNIGSRVQPGQLLMVGHIFAHHPQMAEIKNLIAQGAIGKLTHISSRRLNWGIYQTKTDPLLSLGTHDISIIIELTGDQPQVDQAQAWNYSTNAQPDRVWFSGSVDDSITFDVDVSWHWPVRTRQTIVIGTQGQIVWDQDANTFTVSKNTIKDRRAIVDVDPTTIAYTHDLTPLEAELQHWVDCVASRKEPATGLQQAKQVARVIDSVKQLL
jgi:UDP-2-acetamido-3-amino-2,3-dideoxy-glucuronate N-acetyltransferase